MKTRILSIVFLGALMLTATSFAHEGHHHQAMGTVEAIDDAQITIATAEDETEIFVITDETTYARGEEAVTREDVSVGERAVVMYEKKDGANVAIEVKLPPKAE